MNQYKAGKWYGPEPEKKVRQPRERVRKEKVPKARATTRSGKFQAVVAVGMTVLGLGLSLIIGEVPAPATSNTLALSASASGYNEAFAPLIIKDTAASQEQVSEEKTSVYDNLDVPTFAGVFTDIKSSKDAVAEEETFNPADYTSSLTPDEMSYKLEQSRRNAKAYADAVYRYNNRYATVSSANRNLYLKGYYYGAPQPYINPNYVNLNRNGIPMSQYQMPASLQLDANGIPTSYSYIIEGTGTAYYGGTGTATGTKVCQGVVAVDPREIPYGTEMWITSSDGSIVYGYCRAEDTGGFIYWANGATVDLYMNEYADCCKWGFRGVKIYVLSK